MRRNYWPAVIVIELAACLALTLLAYHLFNLSAVSQGVQLNPSTTAVPPVGQATLPPSLTTTGLPYITLAPTIGGDIQSGGDVQHQPWGPVPGLNVPTTPRPQTYTVVAGDTLWDIAVRFNLDIETLLVANPTLDPDLLTPGEIIYLSVPVGALPTTPAASLQARVSADGGGLRLRKGPGLSQPILTLLDAGTPLNLVGRTGDNGWLQVVTPPGDQGWVMARFVDIFVGLESLPVTGAVLAVPTGAPPALGNLPTPPGGPVAYPYLAHLTEHSRQIFLAGLALGNRPDVFSKVGDSITVGSAFLKPFGYGQYNLREYAALQPVIDYYSHTPARDANSFVNTSLAAEVGWPAQAVLSPKAADPDYCALGEAPLVCEYRWVRPSVALIMLGTNDVSGTSAERFERHLREVIEISIELGVVPVISTLPPMHRAGTEGRVELLNGILTHLAGEYDVPLWDYWSALLGLPNDGLAGDGVHPSLAPFSADFTPENLQYGMTVRNLTALQALDAVWRAVLGVSNQ